MNYQYTQKDLKILKEELSPGIAFFLLIFGGSLMTMLYFIVGKEPYYVEYATLSATLGFILALLVFYLVNRSVIKDLKEQEVKVLVAIIVFKKIKLDYEAGSGALFISILGHLFPKQYGATMRPFTTNIFHLDNGYVLKVDKETYNAYEIGDSVNVLYSRRSEVFLRVVEG